MGRGPLSSFSGPVGLSSWLLDSHQLAVGAAQPPWGSCHIPLLRICMAFPILVGIRFLYLLLWIGNTAILLMKRKLHFFPFSPRMDFSPYHSLHTRPISTQDGFICMSAPTQHLLLEPNIYKHLLLEPNIYYLNPTSIPVSSQAPSYCLPALPLY